MNESILALTEEKAAVAWATGAAMLSGAGWHRWASVIDAMADASDLPASECAPILVDACRSGYLIRQAVAGDRCIRTTSKGQAERAELRRSLATWSLR